MQFSLTRVIAEGAKLRKLLKKILAQPHRGTNRCKAQIDDFVENFAKAGTSCATAIERFEMVDFRREKADGETQVQSLTHGYRLLSELQEILVMKLALGSMGLQYVSLCYQSIDDLYEQLKRGLQKLESKWQKLVIQSEKKSVDQLNIEKFDGFAEEVEELEKKSDLAETLESYTSESRGETLKDEIHQMWTTLERCLPAARKQPEDRAESAQQRARQESQPPPISNPATGANSERPVGPASEGLAPQVPQPTTRAQSILSQRRGPNTLSPIQERSAVENSVNEPRRWRQSETNERPLENSPPTNLNFTSTRATLPLSQPIQDTMPPGGHQPTNPGWYPGVNHGHMGPEIPFNYAGGGNPQGGLAMFPNTGQNHQSQRGAHSSSRTAILNAYAITPNPPHSGVVLDSKHQRLQYTSPETRAYLAASFPPGWEVADPYMSGTQASELWKTLSMQEKFDGYATSYARWRGTFKGNVHNNAALPVETKIRMLSKLVRKEDWEQLDMEMGNMDVETYADILWNLWQAYGTPPIMKAAWDQVIQQQRVVRVSDKMSIKQMIKQTRSYIRVMEETNQEHILHQYATMQMFRAAISPEVGVMFANKNNQIFNTSVQGLLRSLQWLDEVTTDPHAVSPHYGAPRQITTVADVLHKDKSYLRIAPERIGRVSKPEPRRDSYLAQEVAEVKALLHQMSGANANRMQGPPPTAMSPPDGQHAAGEEENEVLDLSALMQRQFQVSQEPAQEDCQNEELWNQQADQVFASVDSPPASSEETVLDNNGSQVYLTWDAEKHKPCGACLMKGHFPADCQKFLTQTTPLARRAITRDHRLCFRCLKPGHSLRACFSKKLCQVDGCEQAHHRLLHLNATEKREWEQKMEEYRSRKPKDRQRHTAHVEQNIQQDDYRSAVIQGPNDYNPELDWISLAGTVVYVQNPYSNDPRDMVLVNCITDKCASHSKIERATCRKIGLPGVESIFTVNTLGGQETEYKGLDTRIRIWSQDLKSTCEIPCQAMPDNAPPCGRNKLPNWNLVKSEWPHLKDIKFPVPVGDGHIKLIIGTQASGLLASLQPDVVGEDPRMPTASKTPLGWVGAGPSNQKMYQLALAGLTGTIMPSTAYLLQDKIRRYDKYQKEKDKWARSNELRSNAEAKQPKTHCERKSCNQYRIQDLNLHIHDGDDSFIEVAKAADAPKFNTDWLLEDLQAEPTRADFLKMYTQESPDYYEKAKTQSEDEKYAYKTVLDTRRRLTEGPGKGHYEVGITWKPGEPNYASNYRQALARYKKSEVQLERKNHREQVDAAIEELIENGFVEEVQEKDLTQDAWFLPTFTIERPDKQTTKIRLIMNAKAPFHQPGYPTGKSLNDGILPGFKNLQDVVDVLCRFRQYPYCLTADISKMFCQVWVREEDRRFLHFLWRKKGDNDKIRIFRHNRHVFGVAGSPFVAIATVQLHAEEHKDRFPEAYESLHKATIMDDTLDSRETPEQLDKLRVELQICLADAGFHVHKFASNCRSVVEKIPAKDRAKAMKAIQDYQENELESRGEHDLSVDKVLGLRWSATTDEFDYSFDPMATDTKWTKRQVLRAIARLYDPLGFLAPYLTSGRMFVQALWKLNMTWDELLKDTLVTTWRKWYESLERVKEIKIPRCTRRIPGKMGQDGIIGGPGPPTRTELHIFVDGALPAYCAVAYTVTYYDDTSPYVVLTQGKARVAPIKPSLTVPRLELMGALTGARMAEALKKLLHTIKGEDVHYWSDSTTVLHWIISANGLQQYVGNRISEIRDITVLKNWHHVPTEENPADIGTRPITGGKFAQSDKWFKGPEFLWKGPEAWPAQPPAFPETDEARSERKKDVAGEISKIFKTFYVASNESKPRYGNLNDSLGGWSTTSSIRTRVMGIALAIKAFQKWRSYKRKTATSIKLENVSVPVRTDGSTITPKTWKNCDKKLSRQRRVGRQTLESLEGVSSDEFDNALQELIAHEQEKEYKVELRQIRKTGVVGLKSRLIKLNPGLDERGILRAYGRLSTSETIPREQSTPILLPRGRMTRLILQDIHERNLQHTGGKETLKSVALQKYIFRTPTQLSKETIAACLRCQKRFPKKLHQQMAPLPDVRIGHIRVSPFQRIGIDLAGPFTLKIGRGMRTAKSWVVLFTCSVIRAIHMELVLSNSADDLFQAFWRFVARRGVPEHINSDNAGNFVATDRLLQETREATQKMLPELRRQTLKRWPHIQWEKNPPVAPHWGGHYERLVGSLKTAMNAAMEKTSNNLSIMQFCTFLCQIEAMVNARPLIRTSDDINDDNYLSPADFLLATRKVTDLVYPRQLNKGRPQYVDGESWQALQKEQDELWTKWLKYYRTTLHETKKWHRPADEEPQKDDICYIVDPESKRGQWPLAKVIQVYRRSTRNSAGEEKEGRVYRVRLQTEKGEKERDIRSLVLLREYTFNDTSSPTVRTVAVRDVEKCGTSQSETQPTQPSTTSGFTRRGRKDRL